MNYAALGKRIRHARKNLHMTQEKLAEECGISASFLGHVERGSRKASLDTLVRIAGALRVDANTLLSDSLPPPASRDEARRDAMKEIYRLLREKVDVFCP